MELINGLPEVANPLLIFVPLALMILSGYSLGRIISIVSKRRNSLLTDLLYGNVILIFAFISGFIVFGFAIHSAKVYFSIFTFLIIVLAVAGLFFMAKSRITFPLKTQFKIIWLENKYVLFGVGLFLSVMVYQGFVTYFHPIFLEYDSIYFFLLISKSILSGDGLNQDFFIGSDVALRLPPLNQATNAWSLHSFGYSAMRLFPIYFVLLASLLIFRLAKTVTDDSFLGLIASSAFLITPALIIISSHFSIQQDIPFIFLLCATFFFVSEIIRSEKPSSRYVLMLILSLSLLSLTREIGVIVSVAIFFLIPAMKYSQGNVGLRAILTVLSLFPLYFLTMYDIFNNGITNSMAIRLISLILSNIAIFYICYHLRNQKQFKEFLMVNLKYLVFLIFPLIFFVSNIVTIGGPFATIIFSSQFGESAILHRQVFDITKNLELSEALRLNLPRADIFLVAVSMGSIFVFLRLRGFIRLVERFNDNIQYPLLLILSIVLLVVWSYLLESGFESARIRHIAYFLPITSTLVVLAMNRKGTGDRLFYYGIIVASTYYFLNYDLEIWNYRGYFGGFYIEPFRSALMTLADFIPAAIVVFALLFYESKEKKVMNWFRSRPYLSRYSSFGFLALLAIQIYSLSSSGLTLSPLALTDQDPPPEWEKNVFEVVDYLNTQEEGKVLSLRAPAISFFTNRTNFDLYNPHTFSRIYPLLLADNNMTKFKERISEMDIKYVVLPNTRSSLYTLTENLKNSSDVPRIIESDRDFERIDFSDFSIYEINPKHTSSIDLLARNYTWKSFGPLTQVSEINGSLNIVVLSTIPDRVYNRAYMQTQLNSTLVKSPYLLSLEYSTQSDSAKTADFVVELRDLNQNHLWGQSLRDTNGTLTRQTFVLPENIVDKPIEARIYVITESIGRHSVSVTNARLSFG